MNETAGVFRDGRVELNAAVDWPNGTPVRVQPQVSEEAAPSSGEWQETWGLDEAEYQDTPEFRAKLIAQMDSFEPLELTPAEEAEWQASRQWIWDHTIAAVRTQTRL